MGQYDVIYSNLINEILEDGNWDKDQQVRTTWIDGTPAYTKSLFGKQLIFNELPIVTTKKLAWRTSIKEILLFWVNQTTKKEDFHNANCHVWDEWFLEDGTIGKSYPYQFESRPQKKVVHIKTKRKEKHGQLNQFIKVGELVEPDYESSIASEWIGKKFSTVTFGEYRVIKISNNRATIQFTNTGSFRNIDRTSISKNQNIKDNYYRYLVNVGYWGDVDSVKNMTKEERTVLYHRWYYMIKRCYDSSYPEYHLYGGRGIFVDERWHDFSQYLRDVRIIPQYHLAKNENFEQWDVDKDYYGANYYGLETGVWLQKGDNLVYRNQAYPIKLIKPDGNEEMFLSIADAEKNYSLSNLNKVLKGERNQVRGFKVDHYPQKEGYVFRYELSRNQVVDLINNIKTNPSSRRLMTSFWNDADADEKALQECAYETIWNVSNGKLNLILGQRSLDVGLGCCFNQFQYYILLCMIAQVCDLEVGTFTHQIGSAHIYERHIEPLTTQAKLTQYETPQLHINKNIKDFFDFTIDDFKLINYQHHPTIKMEVAI